MAQNQEKKNDAGIHAVPNQKKKNSREGIIWPKKRDRKEQKRTTSSIYSCLISSKRWLFGGSSIQCWIFCVRNLFKCQTGRTHTWGCMLAWNIIIPLNFLPFPYTPSYSRAVYRWWHDFLAVPKNSPNGFSYNYIVENLFYPGGSRGKKMLECGDHLESTLKKILHTVSIHLLFRGLHWRGISWHSWCPLHPTA